MKKTCGYSISYCICPKCENKFPIPRKSRATRERKHIKTIWCPFCKEETNMMEIRNQDFYQNGQGNILEQYVEHEDETDAENPYITKTELMECPEMYEFDFQ